MKTVLQELPLLFFSTRQIIRSQFPDCEADPNAWLHFVTMRYIEDSDGATMHELATYLRIKAPSATSLVARLVARGSVRRRVERKDKRVTRLFLTARGKRQLALHQRRTDAVMHRTFSALNERDIGELARLLGQLRDIHGSDVHHSR